MKLEIATGKNQQDETFFNDSSPLDKRYKITVNVTIEKLSQAARVESDKKEAVARAAEEERRKVAAHVEKTRQVEITENLNVSKSQLHMCMVH